MSYMLNTEHKNSLPLLSLFPISLSLLPHRAL